MADRIEREIEEILSKLEDLPGDGGTPDRRPVSILAHRARRVPPPPRDRAPLTRRLNPATFLLAGAGTVIGGLVLASVWAPLIWAAFGGVVVFLGGFVAAFFRRPRPQAQANPNGHFWRDRYINDAPEPGPIGRLARRIRRR
ncbi:MAG: hypothetical protein ACKVT1_17100 [Dehalococcoidia bacterium]